MEIGKQFFFLKQSGKYLYYRSSLKSISKNKLYFFFFLFLDQAKLLKSANEI